MEILIIGKSYSNLDICSNISEAAMGQVGEI